MGFLSGIIGIGSALLGNSQAKKQQQAADRFNQKSLDLQQQALDRELALKQQAQADYDKNYKPLELSYLSMVKDGVKPDIEGVTSRAIGDVNSQFEGSEAARLRQMQRTGVNPNSGRADALGRQLSLSRGLALAGTVNHSRQQEINRAKDLTFARTQDAAQLGINKLNGTPSNIHSASTALSQTYANRANQAQSNANNTMNTWADLGSTVFKAWDQYNTKKNTSTGTVGTGVWF